MMMIDDVSELAQHAAGSHDEYYILNRRQQRSRRLAADENEALPIYAAYWGMTNGYSLPSSINEAALFISFLQC